MGRMAFYLFRPVGPHEVFGRGLLRLAVGNGRRHKGYGDHSPLIADNEHVIGFFIFRDGEL